MCDYYGLPIALIMEEFFERERDETAEKETEEKSTS